MELSTVHRFASSVCELLVGMLLQWLLGCVTDIIASHFHRHEQIPQMFCQEAVMWRNLKHENILPLLGATISPPQLVSTFMPAGDLSAYIKKNPDADRVRLVGVHPRSLLRSSLANSATS